MTGTGVKAIQWALNDMGYRSGNIDGIYGPNTASAVRSF
jgi:peptidoglycan hydrolase-like protein with peptidoglycan-binding domain